MEIDSKSFRHTAEQIGFVITHECYEDTEVKRMKSQVQESYSFWGQVFAGKRFMNLGLWDKKLYKEYTELDFDFSAISDTPDINSQLHLYYMIRPLIKLNFFNKRLLEVGCGFGIGLKASSQLLKTQYALGIDLVNKHILNANNGFYMQDKVNYAQGDAERLPLANNSMDIITNIESSHLYPRIEQFFSEVDRVLAPGGYFCYADHHVPNKPQEKRFEAFLKNHPNLKIVQKCNITKMVQASIYNRLIANEERFYNMAFTIFGKDDPERELDILHLAYAMGLIFLPWWKIRFKKPELRFIAKAARKEKFWGKKYYFYYLVQKV